MYLYQLYLIIRTNKKGKKKKQKFESDKIDL